MKKTYPSQVRYNQENPTISFRLKREEKEKIDQLVEITGKSIAQLVRETLFYAEKEYSDVQEKGFIEGYEMGFKEGHTQGYGRGKDEWGIRFPCNICGEMIYIRPDSNCHVAVIEFLKLRGWAHKECLNRKRL